MALVPIGFNYFSVKCSDPNKSGCPNTTEKIFGRKKARETAERMGWREIGNRYSCPSCTETFQLKKQKYFKPANRSRHINT